MFSHASFGPFVIPVEAFDDRIKNGVVVRDPFRFRNAAKW